MLSKFRLVYAARPNRRARSKAPINYSDDKPEDISNRLDTLPTPSNKGGDGDNYSESDEADPNSKKYDTKVPGSAFQGKDFLDMFDDDTFCSHPSFIGKTNDKSNDPDSSQEECLVFKRIPVHRSDPSAEFSPLER